MFVNWWNSLTGLQQFLACGALPATALLLLQTILLLFGLGGGHDADQGEVADHSLEIGDGTADTEASDLDAPDLQTPDSEFIPSDEPEMPHHDGAHHADGVRIFTVRGIIAFVAVGGWAGIAMVDLGLPNVWASVIAVFSGTLALLLVAWILKWSLSLQENGTLDPKNAIAHVGTVYLTVPPKRTGTGKVNLTFQERFVEMDAVTDCGHPLKPDTQIQVVGISGETTLIVRPLNSRSE